MGGASLALVVVLLLGAGMAESNPRHGGCHGHGYRTIASLLE